MDWDALLLNHLASRSGLRWVGKCHTGTANHVLETLHLQLTVIRARMWKATLHYRFQV